MSIQEREITPGPTGPARTADPDLSESDGLDRAYRDHYGAVAAAARLVCGAEHADDVAQDVFVTLWRHPDKFDPDRGSLRSFLTAMARHKAVDVLRSESARARELRVEAGERRSPSGLDDGLLRGGRWPGSGGGGRPAGRRAGSDRHDVYGHRTYRETATWLGQPEGTVKSRIRSGLRRLLSDLEIDLGRIAPSPATAHDSHPISTAATR